MIRYNNGNSINNNKLDTLIELWRLDPITDEYAGEKSVAVKVLDVYADVRNVNKYRQMKYNELGQQSMLILRFVT